MSTVGVALGGMLASAVIKVAIGHINSTISGEIKLHRNMRNDLENMKMTLESVEAVLGDAERESIKHKSMLLWLKRLKDAANDISDMLEDFEDETDLNLWAATMKKIKMPRKMRSMQKRIQKIKEDRDSYGVQPETRCEERQVPDIRDTAGYVEEAEIIRRTDDCISGSTSYFPLLLTTVIGVSR